MTVAGTAAITELWAKVKAYVDAHSGGGKSVFFGTLTSTVSNATANIVCPEFTAADKVDGTMLVVAVDEACSLAIGGNSKLNVNSTGAISVVTDTEWGAPKPYIFMESVAVFVYYSGSWFIPTNEFKTVNNQSILGSGNISVGVSTWYGTSSTTASTAAKTVTCSGFSLAKGAIVSVTFTTANTAAALTLNVNSTGAKSVYYKNAATSSTNKLIWYAKETLSFIYDGTYWRYIGKDAPPTVDAEAIVSEGAMAFVADNYGESGTLWYDAQNVGWTVAGLLPVECGGTGANNSADARTNIGAQETLVSGTNIKTVNNQSLLGSGNISVGGGGGLTIDDIYPVGSIYMSVNSANPSTLFSGTTWQQISDTFLLAAGSTYAAGTTGGEAEHTLTAAESGVPAHGHGFVDPTYKTGTDGGHSHTITMKIAQDVASGSGKYCPRNNASGTSTSMGSIASNTGTHSHTITKNTSGSVSNNTAAAASAAHNNMPPYLAVYMWKRTA